MIKLKYLKKKHINTIFFGYDVGSESTTKNNQQKKANLRPT